MIKLSILIPSIFERSDSFNALVNNLKAQINTCGFDNSVSIISLIDKRGDMTVGHKRNSLIEMAKSEYIVFVDDDDMPSNDYVLELMTAIRSNADVAEANVIPSGSATLSSASTYVGNQSVRSAVFAVSVEVFQSRIAAGGQIEGVDFTASPFRMGRSLFKK